MNSNYRDPHPLAGETVTLKLNKPPTKTAADGLKSDPDGLDGQEYHIEDYWQNVSGGTWMTAEGNPACIKYAIRSALAGLPVDNEVVYGKVGPFGHLIHVSELGEVVGEA